MCHLYCPSCGFHVRTKAAPSNFGEIELCPRCLTRSATVTPLLFSVPALVEVPVSVPAAVSAPATGPASPAIAQMPS